jgi:hypothetical protein
MNRDIITVCGYCHKEEILSVNETDLDLWMLVGGTVASCFPYLTPEQQLLLDTCYCPTCPQVETDAHTIAD